MTTSLMSLCLFVCCLSSFAGENTVSTLGRLVLIIWLFVVLIIQSSYTASLTSILTVQQLSSHIKGIDSLRTGKERIGFQVGSFAENYLIEEIGIPKSRLISLGSPEEYASALDNGTVAAVVDESAYVQLFLSSHCKFKIVGQEFTKSGWGFVSIFIQQSCFSCGHILTGQKWEHKAYFSAYWKIQKTIK